MKAKLSDKYFSSSINLDKRGRNPSPIPTATHLEAALNRLKIEYRCICDDDGDEAWEFRPKGEAQFSEWREARLLTLKLDILESGETYLKLSGDKIWEVPLHFCRNQFFESLIVLMERYKKRNFINKNAEAF